MGNKEATKYSHIEERGGRHIRFVALRLFGVADGSVLEAGGSYIRICSPATLQGGAPHQFLLLELIFGSRTILEHGLAASTATLGVMRCLI